MRKVICMLAVLSVCLVLLALPLTVSGASPQLYIDPAIVQKHPADVGTDFTVSVIIKDVSDLFGFDIRITWDNTLITFVSLDNTPLNIIWPQGFFEPLPGYQTGVGFVRYDAVATGQPGFTGTGTLFTLKFHVASSTPGQTSIHFDIQTLSDSNANPITHTTTDGNYQMLSVGPPVGGDWAPIENLSLARVPLVAPWVVLALMAVAVSGVGALLKRTRRKA